jgi:hypothetical protein
MVRITDKGGWDEESFDGGVAGPGFDGHGALVIDAGAGLVGAVSLRLWLWLAGPGGGGAIGRLYPTTGRLDEALLVRRALLPRPLALERKTWISAKPR